MLASPLYMQSREDCESSRMPIAPGKPAAMFSWRSEELGNQLKSSISKNADPLNLGRSFIEGNKDHLLSQAKSELMRQENIKLEPSIIVSASFSNKLMLKDRTYRTHNTDILNLDENKFFYKKKLSVKEKVLRDNQIRSMHEMGEIKRAIELRVDEVSVQKLRENHVTIQNLILSCRKCKNR